MLLRTAAQAHALSYNRSSLFGSSIIILRYSSKTSPEFTVLPPEPAQRLCAIPQSHSWGGESSEFISAHPVHCLVSAVTSTQCCGLSASAHHNQRGAAGPAVHLKVQGGLFLMNLLLLIYKKLRCEPTFSPVLTKPLKALTRISRHSKLRLPCSGLA